MAGTLLRQSSRFSFCGARSRSFSPERARDAEGFAEMRYIA
jgi:hypothetical protein